MAVKDKSKELNKHLWRLAENHKDYFQIRDPYILLRINEFMQDLKSNIFNNKINADELIYVLNILDAKKRAVSYIADSFNFLDKTKKEYEAYTLAGQVQPNETIRVMSYHYRYALNNDNIMKVYSAKLDKNVKIKILLAHPYSKFIRLPRTRIEIINATNNLLKIAIGKDDKSKRKYLEVRYYGYIPKDTPSMDNNSILDFDSAEFLFRGHIFGDRAIAIIPYPSKIIGGGLLGDPYYLTWDAQRVYVFENNPKDQTNDSVLNIIELYQRYFDDIWYDKSVTIGQFLKEDQNKPEAELIDKTALSELNKTYRKYIINKNISSCYGKKIIYSELKKHELFQVQIHPTNECSLRCTYCFYKEIKGSSKMKEEIFFKILKDIRDFNRSNNKNIKVLFSGGGEPTLYDHFKDAIKFCKDNELQVGIITNGTFDVELRKFLLENLKSNDFIRFSVDSGTKEKFIEIKRTDEFFYKKVLDNIQSFANANRDFEVSISYAVGRNNCELEEIYELLKFIRNTIYGDIKLMFRPMHGISKKQCMLDENDDTLKILKSIESTCLKNQEGYLEIKRKLSQVKEFLLEDESLTDFQIKNIILNIYEIEKRIPHNVRYNLDELKNRLDVLLEKRKILNECRIAPSTALVEPNGEVFACHVLSRFARSSDSHNVPKLGTMTPNTNFIDLWRNNWTNDDYFNCPYAQFCNPRDILLNKKLIASSKR